MCDAPVVVQSHHHARSTQSGRRPVETVVGGRVEDRIDQRFALWPMAEAHQARRLPQTAGCTIPTLWLRHFGAEPRWKQFSACSKSGKAVLSTPNVYGCRK
jgi:hypothetical protein